MDSQESVDSAHTFSHIPNQQLPSMDVVCFDFPAQEEKHEKLSKFKVVPRFENLGLNKPFKMDPEDGMDPVSSLLQVEFREDSRPLQLNTRSRSRNRRAGAKSKTTSDCQKCEKVFLENNFDITCHFCGKQFYSVDDLLSHYVANSNTLKCQQKPKRAKKRSRPANEPEETNDQTSNNGFTIKEEAVEESDFGFRCSECGADCENPDDLMTHEMARVTCPVCQMMVHRCVLVQHETEFHSNDHKPFDLNHLPLPNFDTNLALASGDPLECEACKMTFPAHEEDTKFKEHLNIKESCEFCQKFIDHRFIMAHIMTKHKSDFLYCNIKCSFCIMGFMHKSAFTAHMSLFHPEKIAKPCDSCSFEDVSDAKLARHLLQHHNRSESKGVCIFCGFSSVQRSLKGKERIERMEMHIRKMHGNDAFETFQNFDFDHVDWETHIFPNAQGEPDFTSLLKGIYRPYKCELCSNKYSSVTLFILHKAQKHNVAETGHAPGILKALGRTELCGTCGERVWNLSLHQKTVHGLKKPKPPKKYFQCESCDYKAGDKHRLKEHFLHKHDANFKPTFTCHICAKAFTFKCNLRTHLQNIHKEDLPAEERERRGGRRSGATST